MEKKLKELLLQRKRKVIFDNHLKHSAVLIPFFIKDGEYHILFIKRSQEVENHKGEISFPGGLCEKSDGGLEETALREAFEETGIRSQDVKVLGTLDDMKTNSSCLPSSPRYNKRRRLMRLSKSLLLIFLMREMDLRNQSQEREKHTRDVCITIRTI